MWHEKRFEESPLKAEVDCIICGRDAKDPLVYMRELGRLL